MRIKNKIWMLVGTVCLMSGFWGQAKEVYADITYIPNTWIEENLMQEIKLFQDKMLSSFYIYNAENNTETLHLRILDPMSGELFCETEIQMVLSYAVTVQVCGEKIVVSDAQNGKIHVFDENLKETDTYEVVGDTIYVDTSVTKAYCLTSGSGIHIRNLESGEEELLLENTADLSFFSGSGNDISIRYIDLSSMDKKECYAGLALETGELEIFEIDDSFSGMEYSSGFWVSELFSEEDAYFLGTQEEPYKFKSEALYPILKLDGNAGNLLFMTTDEMGVQTMTAYAMDGMYRSSFSTEELGGMLTSCQVWDEEKAGYYVICIDNNGYDKLYFWDMKEETEGENLVLTSYYEKEAGGVVLEQSFYEKAEALSKKYGVTVKIADECQTEYSDKLAVQECDPERVGVGLEVLEKALSNYPEGFWRQLRYGAFRTLEINLMGQISNKEEIEGFSPTAFVQQENGKITVVLNIDESAEVLEQNIYHESSHIIDRVLEHDATYREGALYAEGSWWLLNPEEFRALNPEQGGYFESYEMMPMEYYQEEFSSYFVIDYGKSFSTEDRATVFETAIMGTDPRVSSDASQPLYAKLKYYCECIRDCFDTTGWPERTAWEKGIW